MSEYRVCPHCNGKGFTFESNVMTDGIIGLFYDLTEGFYRRTCKLCHGTGKMVVKD